MSASAPVKKESMYQRLRGWVVHFSALPHARAALFLFAFAESSVFPIPPDVLLIAMVLSVPQKWWINASICLAGSVLGGMFGYVIGWQLWHWVDQFFFHYVFSRDVFDRVQSLYQQYDFWAVFAAGFTPIPYKIFTVAAGVCAVNFPVFVLASILSRGARFFIVAALLRTYGRKMAGFIEKYFGILTILFMVLLVSGFIIIKYLVR